MSFYRADLARIHNEGFTDFSRAAVREVLAAIDSGATSDYEILDRAWDDTSIGTVPLLRAAAAATLAAHLDKLRAEGRLPG